MEHLKLPDLKNVRQVCRQWEDLSRQTMEKIAKLVIEDKRWPKLRKCVEYMRQHPGKIPVSTVDISTHCRNEEEDDLLKQVFARCTVKELYFSNLGCFSNLSVNNPAIMDILYATASSLRALKILFFKQGEEGEESISNNTNKGPESTTISNQPLCMSQLNTVTLFFWTGYSSALKPIREFTSYLIKSAKNIHTLNIAPSRVRFPISDIITDLFNNTKNIPNLTTLSLICADSELINQLVRATVMGLRLKSLAINFNIVNAKVSGEMAGFLDTQKQSLRTLRINSTIFQDSVTFPVLSNLVQLELEGVRGNSQFTTSAANVAPNISRLIIQYPIDTDMQVIQEKWGNVYHIILKTQSPYFVKLVTGMSFDKYCVAKRKCPGTVNDSILKYCRQQFKLPKLQTISIQSVIMDQFPIV